MARIQHWINKTKLRKALMIIALLAVGYNFLAYMFGWLVIPESFVYFLRAVMGIF